MEIKEKRIEKVEIQKIYVAADGQEFKDAEQCEQYEHTATCAINQMFASVPHKNHIFYNTGLDMFGGDDEIHVVKIRNMEDLEATNKWLINTFGQHGEYVETLGVDTIGTIQLIVEWCDGFWLIGTPNDLKEKFSVKIDALLKGLVDADGKGENA